MWKSILWGLGVVWGLRAIPLLFVAIVSTFWFFSLSNPNYHDAVTGVIAAISSLLFIYEAPKLYKKINKK